MKTRRFLLDGIRALLFDLDGTLRHTRPSYDQAILEIAHQMGLPDSNERRRQALRWGHYYWAQSPELLHDIQTFAEDRDRFLTNYAQRYAITIGCEPGRAEILAPEIYRRLKEMHLQTDWVPPEVPETLDKLNKAGFTLGVVSNREETLDDLLERLGLDSQFAFTLTSGEVDSWKPDPRIFQRGLELAATTPEQTIYVGDNYFADIIGAQRVGMVPVLLDPERVFADAECAVIRSIAELTRGLA